MRTGLVVMILALAIILVVLLVNLAPLVGEARGFRPAKAIYRGVESSVTMTSAAPRALARAQAWASDAQLVRVEGTWVTRPGWQDVQAPPIAWAFLFYSPGERSVASVVVDDDRELWVPPFEIPIRPSPLRAFPPAQGVEVAWLTFRAAGGEAFLASHPVSQVTFRLQLDGGRPVWLVSAFGDGEFAQAAVDAASGVLAPAASQL
jgi:hypothetical protein